MPYTTTVAITPGIPTSFVPKQPVQTPKRKPSSGTSVFLIASLSLAGIAVLAGGGIFAYSQFLTHVKEAKAAELQQALDSVNADTVRDYIRLKDRLVSGETILDNHVILSSFFNELESVTLQNVQFRTLTVTVAGDGSAKVSMDGIAKNFNALAVQSNAVAADKNFKQAIFSGIGFDTGNQIRFLLTAQIDPDLIRITKKEAGTQPAAPAAALTTPIAAPKATTTATTTP